MGATLYGVSGLVTGAIFAVLLGLSNGPRGFHEMTQARLVALGAAAGFLFPPSLDFLISSGFTFPSLYSAGIGVLLGATSAAASLALARRAEKHYESLQANQEVPALP